MAGEKRWFYSSMGAQHGPVSDSELKGLADGNHLLPGDLIWKEGMERKQASSLKGLFPATAAHSRTMPPPLPTKPNISNNPAQEMSVDRWLYLSQGARYGPVSDSRLKELADSKQLLPDDLVWMEGMVEWKPAKTLDGLFVAKPTHTPVPPPLPSSNDPQGDWKSAPPSGGLPEEDISLNLQMSETELRKISFNTFTSQSVFIVTTHRVRLETKGWGTANIYSIMLEEIDSCVGGSLSSPSLLIMAGLVILGAILGFRDQENRLIFGVIIALFLVVLYLLTRRQSLRVSSARTAIEIGFRSADFQEIIQFLNEIESAKNKRYLMLTR